MDKKIEKEIAKIVFYDGVIDKVIKGMKARDTNRIIKLDDDTWINADSLCGIEISYKHDSSHESWYEVKLILNGDNIIFRFSSDDQARKKVENILNKISKNES